MQQGDRLGSYRILRRLGAGAMGEVWLAEHEMLRKRRALKVLPLALAASPGFRDRFLAEGRVLATLEHPAIVQVHDMHVEGDTHFIAMDFVSPDGERSQSLDDLLKERGGRLPVEEVSSILTQICEAMEYAHSKGVIHRDLKPSNVLVGPKGKVRVSDFGLAKVIGEKYLRESIADSLSGKSATKRETSLGGEESVLDGSSATSEAQSLVGTYHYMPPEVQEGGEWTRQGDIYSLGVLAYVLLTGKRPVGRFKNPSQVVPGLSPVWDSVISRALDDDAGGRFQSASEMLDVLRSIGDAAHLSRAKPTRAKAAALLVVALLAAVLGIAGVLLVSRQRVQSSPAVPERTPAPVVIAMATPVVAPPSPTAIPPTPTVAPPMPTITESTPMPVPSTPTVIPPSPTPAASPTRPPDPTPDDSVLNHVAQEASRRQQFLEAAKAAYRVACSVDESEAATQGQKVAAWKAYLDTYQSSGYMIPRAEERLAEHQSVAMQLMVPRVEDGCIFVANPDLGSKKQLTSTGLDSSPVVSPDGRSVAFVRRVPGMTVDTGMGETGESPACDIWLIGSDGSGARRLVRSRADKAPERMLADFHNLRFSSDGTTLYFLSTAFVTSSALHTVEIESGKEQFVCGANTLEIVGKGRCRGHLLVSMHRYGPDGAEDAYWLLTPEGKEVRKLSDDPEAAMKMAEQE